MTLTSLDPASSGSLPSTRSLFGRINHSIAARISLVGCIVLFLILSCITAALTAVTTQRSRQQQAEWLHARAEGVIQVIDGVDLTSRTMIERVFPVLSGITEALRAARD